MNTSKILRKAQHTLDTAYKAIGLHNKLKGVKNSKRKSALFSKANKLRGLILRLYKGVNPSKLDLELLNVKKGAPIDLSNVVGLYADMLLSDCVVRVTSAMYTVLCNAFVSNTHEHLDYNDLRMSRQADCIAIWLA